MPDKSYAEQTAPERWPVGPELFGARLRDLPDHLMAYHGWTDDEIQRFDGSLRRMHLEEHDSRERDHVATDWSS